MLKVVNNHNSDVCRTVYDEISSSPVKLEMSITLSVKP